MKNLSKLFTICLFAGFISCSSDDDGSSTPSNTFSIPLNSGNYWTYDVEDTNGMSGRDSLFVGNDTVINSKTYKKMKVRNNMAMGFYSSSLRNNGVRKENNKMYLTGDLSLAAAETLPINLDVTLSDFVIFDADASTASVLSTKSGVIQETFNSIPLTINYTLKSVAGESLASYTLGGTTYNNVKKMNVVLNLSVSAIFSGIPLPITVLQPQDVLTSTLHIADGVGMIYSSTNTTYNIDINIADQLGIDPSQTQTQTETISTYNLD